MAFLAAVAKFLSKEVLSRLGKDVLAEGQRVFAQELTKGTPRKEAARITAEHMLKFSVKQNRDDAVKLGKAAGRMASKGAALGVKALREKLGKK